MSEQDFHEMSDKLDAALGRNCGWTLRRLSASHELGWLVALGRDDADGNVLRGEGSTPEAAIEAALRVLRTEAQRRCADAEQKAREARDTLDQVVRAETK